MRLINLLLILAVVFLLACEISCNPNHRNKNKHKKPINKLKPKTDQDENRDGHERLEDNQASFDHDQKDVGQSSQNFESGSGQEGGRSIDQQSRPENGRREESKKSEHTVENSNLAKTNEGTENKPIGDDVNSSANTGKNKIRKPTRKTGQGNSAGQDNKAGPSNPGGHDENVKDSKHEDGTSDRPDKGFKNIGNQLSKDTNDGNGPNEIKKISTGQNPSKQSVGGSEISTGQNPSKQSIGRNKISSGQGPSTKNGPEGEISSGKGPSTKNGPEDEGESKADSKTKEKEFSDLKKLAKNREKLRKAKKKTHNKDDKPGPTNLGDYDEDLTNLQVSPNAAYRFAEHKIEEILRDNKLLKEKETFVGMFKLDNKREKLSEQRKVSQTFDRTIVGNEKNPTRIVTVNINIDKVDKKLNNNGGSVSHIGFTINVKNIITEKSKEANKFPKISGHIFLDDKVIDQLISSFNENKRKF